MAYFSGSDFMACKTFHSMATINNKVYNWGGFYSDMPEVHRSPLKDSLTSTVEVFDLESLSWNSVSTTGVPPAAVMQYSCCSLGSKMYTFGGSCKPSDCYHNDLFALDTLNKEWRQVDCIDSPTTSPMKKQGAGMVSLTKNDQDFLLVFGGVGLTPTTMPSTGQYVPHPVTPKESFTNEAHMLSSTGWTVAVVTGTTPPPMAWFTLNILPSQDKAILFGGLVVEGFTRLCNKNVYILALMKNKNQVQFQLLHCSNSPMSRHGHSSTVVTINESAYLIVIGGVNDHLSAINDLWILDIEAKRWQKVKVPGSVCKRYDHAIASIKITNNRVLIIINGGCSGNHNNKDLFVVGADITVVVELVYSNKDWSVVNVWNSEQLKKNRSQIHRQLVQYLIDQNYDKGTLHELITIMQSPTKGLNDNAQLRLVQQQNTKLQLGLTLSRVALLYKIQELKQSRELAEGQSLELEKLKKGLDEKVESEDALLLKLNQSIELAKNQKKMLLGQTMELEKLMKEGKGQVSIGEDKEPDTDKLAILKEENEERLQLQKDELSNEQESDNTLSQLQPQDEEFSKDPSSVDIGVQFSWVDVKTDHLQGLTVFKSKYFHVEGEKAHPLIWEGFGFELHLPEHTFLPKEECCIRVDAVIGGDFGIPEGVEPVSAIYVISITTKLRQPSLLKIQHCVDLDRVHPDSGLSFYTTSLKESSPPYHFKRVPGGRFDVLHKYGVLELPVFCAKFIGKDQGGTQSDNSVEGDDSSSSGLDSSMALDTMDDSIMYRGQLFYLHKSLNQWQVKFIVVKNIDAFAEYVASELRGHEADALVDIVSCVNNIKLEGEPSNVPNGWTVFHHTTPLSISMKRANVFGSEKVVSSPPFCMLTIDANDAVVDFNKVLSYPLTLKDCVTVDAHNEPVISIIRTMTKGNVLLPSVSLHQKTHPKDELGSGPKRNHESPEVDEISKRVTEVFDKSFPKLKTLFENNLEEIAAELLSVGIITRRVATSPSFETIIQGFYSGFSFLEDEEEIKDWCGKFLSSLRNVGGAFSLAAKTLEKQLQVAIGDKI